MTKNEIVSEYQLYHDGITALYNSGKMSKSHFNKQHSWYQEQLETDLSERGYKPHNLWIAVMLGVAPDPREPST